ncbi:Ig-like domain-containing protein, partial [Salmonella enterica]|nr:Ig-like domain-containing protein [Salmonella enterica]
LKSGDNQPVTGLADQLALSGVLTPDHQVVDVKSGMRARAAAPASGTPGLSTLKEDSAHPGTYTGTLTAGTTAGKYALTLNLNHAPLLTTNVTLTDTMADISQSTLTADKNTVTASDGSDPANVVHFTVTLKDKAGKPVSREAGRLKLATTTSGVDTARLKFSDLREDGTQQGVYTGTLSSTLAVKALPVVLMVNGKNSGKTTTVTVTPDAVSADPALTVTKDNALADGTDRNTLAITVADRYGNPVGNTVVGLTVTPADHTSIAPQVTADAAGKATVSLTSKLPGDKTVTATVTGSGNHRDQTVTFRADPSVTVKHLNIADGAGTTVTERPVGVTDDSKFHLEATVLDGQGNAVAGMPVSWTLDQSACADTSTTAKLDKTQTDTDAKGVATATLTSAGKHVTCDRLTITAAVPGTAAMAGHVKYIAEAKSAMVTKNTVTSPYTDYLADGKAHADYRARVTDQYSNPVKGISVAWSGGKTAVFTTTGPVTTDDKGDATNSLTSTAVLQDVAPVATVNSALKGSTTATADRKVNFVANAGTATLSGITVTDDAGKTVDTLPVGTTAASVFHASATVVDSNGNPVSGQTVTWSLDQGACGTTAEAKLSTVTATTDSAGHSTATVASISPYHVCSGLKLSAAVGTAGHKTTTLNYIAEEASANVKTVALPSGAKTTYTADGKDTATWNATVADQYGNAVSGETVTWGGVTGAQPKYAAATTTTDAAGHTSNTMTSTTAATNVKATATVSSTTHTGTAVTASTPIAFTADVSKATLTVTVTGSRQPTETDTSHTAATADGTDLLTLHFKAVDGNGNPITSTPVHYTTAVTDAGIVKDTLACTTNTNGECTSTVKTTKAGTYNVWVALVPAGAAQPVSPVKTALVFLAGDPVPSGTTFTTYPSNPRAYTGEEVTIDVTAKDAYGNVVPGWVLAQELQTEPDEDVFTIWRLAHGDSEAAVTLKINGLSSDVRVSEKVREAVTTVTVGPNITARVDTSLVPNVGICLDPGDGALPGDSTINGAIVGVSKWRLCVYAYDKFNGYTLIGYVPKKYEATYDAELHSNYFADGNVIGQKLKFKQGLSWGNGASHGTAELLAATGTVRDLIQTNVLKNPARALAHNGVWNGTDGQPERPKFVGYFTGYSGWSSSDRDRDNMGSSAREICVALGALNETANIDWSPAATVIQTALSSNPEAAAMTRVNTYGGGHDLIIYNEVPGDRGNGYYPFASFGPLGRFPVYGIWNKSTVTKEVIASKLTQNVQGAYCTAP